jgi:hypothetical protein
MEWVTRLGESSPQSAPLVLGQICASWRHIALSSPKVRTNILQQMLTLAVTYLLYSLGDPFLSALTKESHTKAGHVARAGSVPFFFLPY